MYTTINVESLETGDDIDINTDTYPVNKFAWEPSLSANNPKKLFSAGSWDGHTRVKDMPIDIEGHIAAPTVEDYWAARKAFMAIIMPYPEQTERNHCKFTLTLDDTTVMYAICQLADITAPTEAFYPTVTAFMANFTNNFGYWRKVSDDSVVFV